MARPGSGNASVHLLDWTVRADGPDAAYRAIKRAAELSAAFLPALAFSAHFAHRPHEARAALRRLGAIDASSLDRADHLYLMADAYHQLRDHRRELQAARRARHGNPQGLDALYQEVRARAAPGEVGWPKHGRCL